MTPLALVEHAMDVRSPGDGLGPLVLFGALALVTCAWALRYARGRGSGALVALGLMILGAMLAVFNEPIYDLLGKVYYPANSSPTYFTAFERPIPVFLLAGYVPFVGILPFVMAEKLRDGVSRTALRRFALGSFAGVVIVETIGTSTHSWVYYGEAPMKWIGVAPQMAAVPLLAACLLLWSAPHLHGVQRGALLFIGPISLAAVYAATSWPMYVALYSDWPAAADAVASALSLGLVAGVVWGLSAVVGTAAPPEAGDPPVASPRPTAMVA